MSLLATRVFISIFSGLRACAAVLAMIAALSLISTEAHADYLETACGTDPDGDGVANTWRITSYGSGCLGSFAIPPETIQTSCWHWGSCMSLPTDNCSSISNSNQLNTDGDTQGNVCDSDDDNDGIADGSDNCPLNANASQLDTDGDGQGDACDNDDDNDGVADASDKFPLNAAASSDTDNDGFPNSWNASCNATCQSNSGLVLDNCPLNANANQLDTDGDGQGDVCDSDDDNDGVLDGADKFPLDAFETIDTDNDGIGNNADPDDDGDGVLDVSDNCPLNTNANQLNTDGDGQGDLCDSDDDNDGVPDVSDAFPLDATESADTDGDGIGNNADTDNDNDGISNVDEIALGSDPLNNLDPPRVAISYRYIVGVDNHDAAAEAYVTLWRSTDGAFDIAGTCPECVAPGFFDMVMASSADVCGVNATGMHCLWWIMDSGAVEWPELLPVQVAGQTVNPIHDWDGYLKYVDQSSALHYLAKDAYRISGDHVTHACFVSKSMGVYCWANHSGTDIISGNIPASLRDVSTVKDVAVGANHACAINNTAVQCWGDASSNKTTVPAAVNAPKQLAAGANHTCVINADNTVSCWGDNSANQLGDSNADGIVDGVSSALRIAAGANHTCAVTGSYATPSSLRVTCWGSNSAGQTTVPVDLTNGVAKPVSITAAGDETCAIKAGLNVAASAMLCWPVGVAP